MTFPSSNTSDLATAWGIVRAIAGQVRSQASGLNAAPAITRKVALDFANFLADSLASFDTYTAVPGLGAYAQNQVNSPGLNIANEYTTMRTQIVGTQDWLVANFPKDASSNLAVYVFDGSKRYADVPLTAPQLSAFKSQLTSLIATIG